MKLLVNSNNKAFLSNGKVLAIDEGITSLTVTPTTSQQTITASSGVKGYSPITVNAVTSGIDSNITAENIKKDVTILGVTGTYEGGGSTPTLYRYLVNDLEMMYQFGYFSYFFPKDSATEGTDNVPVYLPFDISTFNSVTDFTNYLASNYPVFTQSEASYIPNMNWFYGDGYYVPVYDKDGKLRRTVLVLPSDISAVNIRIMPYNYNDTMSMNYMWDSAPYSFVRDNQA